MRYYLIFFFVICFCTLGYVQTATFITISSGNRFDRITINNGSCTTTSLSLCNNFLGTPRSIALDNNILYIVDNQGYLYSNNLTSTGTLGNCNQIGRFAQNSGGYFGMTVGPNGLVYAAIGGDIEVYNPSTNTFSLLGTLPNGWQIGGDLLFYQNKLYEAATNGSNNILVEVNLNNISQSTLYMNFNAGSNVFGFASVTVPCSNNQAYAISNNGNSTDIYEVDMLNKTQSTNRVCNLPFRVNDAASVAETQSLRPAYNDTINLSSCDSVWYKNKWYKNTTTVFDTLKSVQGCDSLFRRVEIFIKLKTTSFLTITANNSYNWNGVVYTQSGTYNKIGLVNSVGCDSTATLSLTINILNQGCWKDLSAAFSHSLAIKKDGTLWAWGDNSKGQLGNGQVLSYKYPIQITSDYNWFKVSSFFLSSFAIKNNGTLWAWGDNSVGQLGDGTFDVKLVPTQIGLDTNWSSVNTGINHTVAIKSDGSLWAWGKNDYGQFGDGTTISKNVPIQIGTHKNWKIAKAARYFTIALKTDSTLWAWGFNSDGELGDGTNTNKSIPIKIGNDNDWVNVDCGETHSIALKSDGTLWAWGQNLFGQLGDGTNINKNYPVKVGQNNDWVSLNAGLDFNLATKKDNSLWTWGSNQFFQLGDGTNFDKNTPVKISNDKDWSSIHSAFANVLILKTDGTLWAWGNNVNGNLGDSTIIDKNIPSFISTGCKYCSSPTTASQNFNSCKPLFYNGVTYYTSTVLKDTIKTQDKVCDSIYKNIHINISSISPIYKTQNFYACKSFEFNGVIYSSTISLRDTLKSQFGCDSVYNSINIIINNLIPSLITNTLNGCNQVFYNNIFYNTSITLKDTIKSILGCDSIYRTTNIVVQTNSPLRKTINFSGCDSVWFRNKVFTTNTYITDTLKDKNGCDSFYINHSILVNKKPTIGNNRLFYTSLNQTISLNPLMFNDNSYNWQPNKFLNNNNLKNPLCTPTQNIDYKLTVTSTANCSDTATIKVLIKKSIVIPNSFSPNGDGVNDLWKISNIEAFLGNNVKVFDRYGMLVFNKNNFTSWDGKLNNNFLPSGVYYYIVNLGNQLPIEKGYITIFR